MSVIQTAVILVLLGIEVYCDLKDRTIPDKLSLAIAAAAFIDFHPENLWGLLPAALFFISAVFMRVGGGDVKAVAALSLSLGLWGTLLLIFTAELSMLLFYGISAVVQKIRGRTAEKNLPFLPFITIGYVFTIFI